MNDARTNVKKKIMLADDDPFILEIYTSKLTREGFDVFSVGDGEEAILKLDSIEPDLLILDMNMPRIDGLEVLRYIRSRPERSEIPVVVLSNAVTESMMKDIWELKPTRFLTKRDSRPKNVLAEIQAILKEIDSERGAPAPQPEQTPKQVSAQSEPAARSAPAFELNRSLKAIDAIAATQEQEQRQKALLTSYKLVYERIELLRKGDPRNPATQFARTFESFYDHLYSAPNQINPATCRTLRQATDLIARALLESQSKDPHPLANTLALLAVEDRKEREQIAGWLERLGHKVISTRDFAVAASLTEDNRFDLAVAAAGRASAVAKLKKRLASATAQVPKQMIMLVNAGQFERVDQDLLDRRTDLAALPAIESEIALKSAMIRLTGEFDG